MNKTPSDETEKLFKLARDKSVAGRTALVATVSDLFFGHEDVLSEKERTLMTEILNQLLHDVEMTVRRELAERLADQEEAPRDLIITLANDEIDVARPILLKSSVLRDAELIEIIQHRTHEHQLTVAMREGIGEDVSEILVETGDEDVISALLENPAASISQGTMEYLAEESQRVDRYQKPLLSRGDLGPDLAKKMYWWVSAALRSHIMENFDIDPGELDATIEDSVGEAMTHLEEDRDESSKPFRLARELADKGEITPKMLIQILRQGEIMLFEALLVELTGLRLTLVRRIIFESGGEGLAIACKAAGFEKPDFASIFLLCRKARPGDKIVDPKELSHVLKFYDKISLDAAESVLQRMSLDPGYLDSLRRIGEGGDKKGED